MRVHVEKNEKEWKTRDLGDEGLLRRSISPKTPSSCFGITLLASFLLPLFKFSSPFYNFRFCGMKFGSLRAISSFFGVVQHKLAEYHCGAVIYGHLDEFWAHSGRLSALWSRCAIFCTALSFCAHWFLKLCISFVTCLNHVYYTPLESSFDDLYVDMQYDS